MMLVAAVGRAQEEAAPSADPAVENEAGEARKERRRDRTPPSRGEASESGVHPASTRPSEGAELQLTEQQLQLVKNFVKQHLPKLHEELELLAKASPRHYEREINKLVPRISRLLRERDGDPESFELSLNIEEMDVAIRRKVRRYLNLRQENQRESSRMELRTLAARRFDLEQRRGLRQIEALEQRLAVLRTELESRAARKDEWIDRELDERLQETRKMNDEGGRVKDE